MEEIVNKVAKSDIKVIDLSELHDQKERVFFDLKDCLIDGVILKEKNFREFVSEHDWSSYTNKNVAIGCSADSIIPVWAYMLVMSKIQKFANHVISGDLNALENDLFKEAISKIELEKYKDAKVVIKGCSDVDIPAAAYAEITRKLLPVASSIMYGEPCSTVPIFKRPKV